MIVEAEAGKFGDAELFAQNAFGIIGMEDPIFDAGFDAAHAIEEGGFRGFEELLGPGEKSFAGADELEFIAQRFFRGGAGEFGGLEFAGREIDQGEADDRGGRVLRYGGEKIVFAGVEDSDVGGGAGSDDAGDFASDEFFAGPGCSICSQMATLKPARMRRAM